MPRLQSINIQENETGEKMRLVVKRSYCGITTENQVQRTIDEECDLSLTRVSNVFNMNALRGNKE